jgi:hypothetical protein
MLADVAQRHRAQQRIDQRMDRHIGMARKTLMMLDLHAAEPQFLAIFQPVDVIAGAHADGRAGLAAPKSLA